MHTGGVAAGHQYQIAGVDLRAVDQALLGIQARQAHRADAQPPAGAEQRALRLYRQAGGSRRLGPGPFRARAQVADHRNRAAGAVQIERRPIGLVAGRDHDHAPAGDDGVAIQKTARRRGQHDAGPIIAWKHQRPLDGAGGEHHLARPHLPAALARLAAGRIRQMIGQALVQGYQVVREVAERRRTRQQRDALIASQGFEAACQPCGGRLLRLRQQRAAELRLLVTQDHACAGGGGCHCRGHAARASTDHQHVAMRVAIAVAVGIGRARGAPQSRGGSDIRFV